VTARPRPWQVWWADLNPVAGREQAGHRPVVVVSTAFHLRLTHGQVVTVVPLTTSKRPFLLHRVEVTIPGHKPSYAITEQLRTISVQRLTGNQPLWRLPDDLIAELRDVLHKMIDV
jgi:mRNA interferase MazF